MTGSTASGDGKTARTGAQALSLLSSPLNCRVLQALGEEPLRLADLRRACGMPPQTTLRAQLKMLHDLGTIEKRRRDRFPGVLEYELSEAGRDLLPVASALERWLAAAPEGPLEPSGSAAKAAVKALVQGWSTCMLRALATRPLTLTELDDVIASHNYPSLERRLSALRLTGQVEARPGDGRATPYGLSPWGRAAVAPIAAAARWERRHLPAGTAPLRKVDVESAFLMSMPLLRLPGELEGTCRMAADLPDGGRAHALAGVLVEARDGTIASCTTRLEGYPDAWASGSAAAWLAVVVDGDASGLEVGGDSSLARGLLDGLHSVLFSPQRR